VTHCLAHVAALALVAVALVDGVEVCAQTDLACAHLCDDRADRSMCADIKQLDTERTGVQRGFVTSETN
jgi:hypothetical protein